MTLTNPNTFGDLIPLDEFRDCVEGGGFTDYDGVGYPANRTHHSNESVDLESLDKFPPEVTHILWFNK